MSFNLQGDDDQFDLSDEKISQQEPTIQYLAPFDRTKLFQSDDLDDMLALQEQFMLSQRGPSATIRRHNDSTPSASTILPSQQSIRSPSDPFAVVDMMIGQSDQFETLLCDDNRDQGNTLNTPSNFDDDAWFNDQPQDYLPFRGGLAESNPHHIQPNDFIKPAGFGSYLFKHVTISSTHTTPISTTSTSSTSTLPNTIGVGTKSILNHSTKTHSTAGGIDQDEGELVVKVRQRPARKMALSAISTISVATKQNATNSVPTVPQTISPSTPTTSLMDNERPAFIINSNTIKVQPEDFIDATKVTNSTQQLASQESSSRSLLAGLEVTHTRPIETFFQEDVEQQTNPTHTISFNHRLDLTGQVVQRKRPVRGAKSHTTTTMTPTESTLTPVDDGTFRLKDQLPTFIPTQLSFQKMKDLAPSISPHIDSQHIDDTIDLTPTLSTSTTTATTTTTKSSIAQSAGVGVSQNEIDSTVQMLIAQMQSNGGDFSDYLSEAFGGWGSDEITAFQNRKKKSTGDSQTKLELEKHRVDVNNNENKQFLQSVDKTAAKKSAYALRGQHQSNTNSVITKLTKNDPSDPSSNSSQQSSRSILDNFANEDFYKSILQSHNNPEIATLNELTQQVEPWELIPSLRSKYGNKPVSAPTSAQNSSTRPIKNKYDVNSWLTPIDSHENDFINHHEIPSGNNSIFLLSQIPMKKQGGKAKGGTGGDEGLTSLQLYQRLSSLFHVSNNINHKDSSYIALTTQLTDLRFDLDGNIVYPFSSTHQLYSGSTISTGSPASDEDRRELYHHSNQPGRPGYTVDEFVLYLRSTYPSQVILALNAIYNIVTTARRGFYYEYAPVFTKSSSTPATPTNPPPTELEAFVTKNISSTLLETLLIREIPQLCLYILINNRNGLQNQHQHNSTLVFHALRAISAFLSPLPTSSLYATEFSQLPQPILPFTAPNYCIFDSTPSISSCTCHIYHPTNSTNSLLFHFMTTPSSSTLPAALQLQSDLLSISPLFQPLNQSSAAQQETIQTGSGNIISPQYHSPLFTTCPIHSNPYQNKSYYTHSDTPHYVQRYLQTLFFEHTYPKLLQLSNLRRLPLALSTQIDSVELAKQHLDSIDHDNSMETRKKQLYDVLHDEKIQLYSSDSREYADRVQKCIHRGNEMTSINSVSTNQLFLYDLCVGALAVGILEQLFVLLRYYTYLTDPVLIPKSTTKQQTSLLPPTPLTEGYQSDNSHFLGIQLSVLEILTSLSSHSLTAASIVVFTDGLLPLLSQFLSVSALISISKINPTSHNIPRLQSEKRLLSTINLLLKFSSVHPILLNEIDSHVHGSILSYFTFITAQSLEHFQDLTHQYHILHQLNIINPLLWFILGTFNGGSAILPLKLFSFNNNQILLLYRCIAQLFQILIEFIITTNSTITPISTLFQQYPALQRALSFFYLVHSQFTIYIISTLHHHSIETPENDALQFLTSAHSFEDYIVDTTTSMLSLTPRPQHQTRLHLLSTHQLTQFSSLLLLLNMTENSLLFTAIAHSTRILFVTQQFLQKINPPTHSSNSLSSLVTQLSQHAGIIKSNSDSLFSLARPSTILNAIELHHAYPTFFSPQSSSSSSSSDFLFQVQQLEHVVSLYETPQQSTSLTNLDSMQPTLDFYLKLIQTFLVRPDTIFSKLSSHSSQPCHNDVTSSQTHPFTPILQNNMYFNLYSMNSSHAHLSHIETIYLSQCLLHLASLFKSVMNDISNFSIELTTTNTDLFNYLFTVLHSSYSASYFLIHILLAMNYHHLAFQLFLQFLCNIEIVQFLAQYQSQSPSEFFFATRILLQNPLQPQIENFPDNIDVEKIKFQNEVNRTMLHHTFSSLVALVLPIFSTSPIPACPSTYYSPLQQINPQTNSSTSLDQIDFDESSSSFDLAQFQNNPVYFTLLTSTYGHFTNIIFPEDLLTKSIFPPAPQHIISHPTFFLPDVVAHPASLRGFVTISALVSSGFAHIKLPTSSSTISTTSIFEMIFKNTQLHLFFSLSSQPHLLQSSLEVPFAKNSNLHKNDLIPAWLFDTFCISVFTSYSPSSSLSIIHPKPYLNFDWAVFLNVSTLVEHVLSNFVENGDNATFVYFLILLFSSSLNGQLFKVHSTSQVNSQLSFASKNETLSFITALVFTVIDVFPNIFNSIVGKSISLLSSQDQLQDHHNTSNPQSLSYIDPLSLVNPLHTTALLPDQHTTELGIHLTPLLPTNMIHNTNTCISYNLSFAKAFTNIYAQQCKLAFISSRSPFDTLESSTALPSLISHLQPIVATYLLQPLLHSQHILNNPMLDQINNDIPLQKTAIIFQTLIQTFHTDHPSSFKEFVQNHLFFQHFLQTSKNPIQPLSLSQYQSVVQSAIITPSLDNITYRYLHHLITMLTSTFPFFNTETLYLSLSTIFMSQLWALLPASSIPSSIIEEDLWAGLYNLLSLLDILNALSTIIAE